MKQTIIFDKTLSMKYIMLYILLLSSLTGVAQTAKVKLPPVTDTFATNLLASARNFIRLAENPKNDISYFTQDLRETTTDGRGLYTSPFPLPGFTANVRKVNVYRDRGYDVWMWSARFADAPRGKQTDAIKSLIKRADTLLHFFDSHKKPGVINAVTGIAVYDNLNRTWMPNEFAEITITFSRPSVITEQQAYDSLVNLYKPLLFQKGFAAECAEKLGGAFELEAISRPKVSAFFTATIGEIANKDMETAYAVMIEAPDFMTPEQLLGSLSSSQRAAVKTLAQKDVAEFYKKYNGGEIVATEQKKQVNPCDKIKDFYNGYLFRKGITVIGFGPDGKPVIRRVSAIDCANEKVSVITPGVKGYTPDIVQQLNFKEFSTSWQKCTEQYYQCSRCGGAGGEQVTKTDTKTKELPFGYFDGITTTVTKTKTSTSWLQCYKCKGTGWALEKDRDLWNTGR